MFEIIPQQLQPRGDLIGNGFTMVKRRVLAILALDDSRLYSSTEVVRSFLDDYSLPEYSAEYKAFHRFSCYHQIKGTSDTILKIRGRKCYFWLGSSWKAELTPMAYAWACELHDSLLLQARANEEQGLWSRFYCTDSLGTIITKTGHPTIPVYDRNVNLIPCIPPLKRSPLHGFRVSRISRWLAKTKLKFPIEKSVFFAFANTLLLALCVFGSVMLHNQYWFHNTTIVSSTDISSKLVSSYKNKGFYQSWRNAHFPNIGIRLLQDQKLFKKKPGRIPLQKSGSAALSKTIKTVPRVFHPRNSWDS